MSSTNLPENPKRHFTATVYIMDGNRALLIYHDKLGTWLPPGGHIEENELPIDAARREALEETGLEIAFLQQENLWIDHWNASSTPRPYLCLVENIPATPTEKAHQHMDQIFVATPAGGELRHEKGDMSKIKWFTMEQVNRLQPDKEIFMETVETLHHLFQQLPNLMKV